MWKLHELQRKYEPVVDFSASIGSKYEGTYFSGYLDIDKVFNNSDEIITKYMKLLLRIFKDLIAIQHWLIQAIPKSSLSQVRRGVETIEGLLEMTLLQFKVFIENHIDLQHRRIF